MSHPSDGRRSIDSRQPLPPLTTELSDPSVSSLQQQQSWNRQPDERSPVTPGEGVGGGVSGQVGGVGGSGAGGTDGNAVISHGNSPKSHTRICQKCGSALTGQFVRALGGAYHLDCFKCRVSTDFYFISLLCLGLNLFSKHSMVLHPSGFTNSSVF